jgi:hypothetical protein
MSRYPQAIEYSNRWLVVPRPQSYDEARDQYERLAPVPDFARFHQHRSSVTSRWSRLTC